MGLIFLVGIGSTITQYFAVLPKNYQKIPPKLIWLTLVALGLNFFSMILAPTAPEAAGLISLGSFGLYYLVRAVCYIGLAGSYRAYAADHPISNSPVGLLAAIAASTIDAILFVGVIVSAVV